MTPSGVHQLLCASGILLAVAACAAAQPPAAPAFDGTLALEHVRQLVAIGPRVAGTPGAQHARDYITKEMAALGLKVQEQAFEAKTPLGPANMVNLRVTVPGAATSGRLIVAGHYDTRRFTDFTFVGANDGGSSAAFLIELARVLAARKNPLPIELLFLDGEEAVIEWQNDDHTYGSRYYVDQARADGTLASIRALVLVDMIGDANLRLPREPNSTRWLVDAIWGAAKKLKRAEFVDEEFAVEDDHFPFLKAGVPAVDIIDLEYPAWHTAADTMDKLSARSLQTVGDVLLAALPEIESRLR
ncbi:MAG TPA: M28 family peptidase [Vicinamibacterales bacterium]|nr:M28 family peptidase [Vicinamibacterales bacterium]